MFLFIIIIKRKDTLIMRKTFFLLFAGMVLATTAQTKETTQTDAPKKAVCEMSCQQHGPRAGKKDPKANHARRMSFMKDLNESDRATVKSVMEQYHKDCKAAREKYRAQKPAKGEKLSEKQMDARVKSRMECRMEVLKLQEKYYDKLRKTLTPRQASAILGMNGKGTNRPQAMHGHRGTGKRQGHHACGRNAGCPRS